MNLNSVLIGSSDPARLAAYYTRLFGAPGWTGGEFTGWKIGDGFITIGPHSEVKGSNAEPGRLIWNVESADVEGDFARLAAAGAIVVREPYHPGEADDAMIATFADPDGNYFQLLSPIPM
jgi:predicted enzyme related to lactoylglutathione lyase